MTNFTWTPSTNKRELKSEVQVKLGLVNTELENVDKTQKKLNQD